jgi:DNA-binding response OmpR family regulator
MSEILIVEDGPSIAEMLWLHAQEAGHRPVVACTGKKAKELIDERLPAAVILGWTLPDMTRLSLLMPGRTSISSSPFQQGNCLPVYRLCCAHNQT